MWPAIEPLVVAGLSHGHGEYMPDDIREGLLLKDMQLWANGRAIGVTEITKYPRKSVCTVILAAGGPMGDWLPFVEIIEAWATSKGCSEIRAFGRKGWERVMAQYGWQRAYAVVRKAL